MAKNYTMGQAARIFAENKVEEMADIMRRFPYASMMLMKLNEEGVLCLEALPEFETVRKLDKLRRKALGILKSGDDEDEDVQPEVEDEEEKPAKKEKKASKKPAKKSKKVEDDEDENEDDDEDEKPSKKSKGKKSKKSDDDDDDFDFDD